MRRPRRIGWLIGIALAVPILPFVVAGPWIEASISSGLAALEGQPLAISAAVMLVLGMDIFLPVPSSAVATLAGQTLGPPTAIACVWTGLMASSAAGFELARRWGGRLTERLCSRGELAASGERFRRWGVASLIITRPLPVFAEACVLWAGVQRFPRQRFYIAMAWANGAVAAGFVVLGWVSAEGDFPALGLVVSFVLPLLLMVVLRRSFSANRL